LTFIFHRKIENDLENPATNRSLYSSVTRLRKKLNRISNKHEDVCVFMKMCHEDYELDDVSDSAGVEITDIEVDMALSAMNKDAAPGTIYRFHF
jgi:hypothetical protein